ncbi:unnamed protein product [Lactuca saligna]|uniref:Peptidase S9 prolyl oligopeptidase catalytic domain-containing protein n=1 Tax=Lactuca saligna TaxID=75948 RepID=A0AA36EPQ0_LACSI|nr:unnamed protein product [Lactuca saligna]
MRPDLFKATIVGVPFIDVVTTMLGPTIPLTTAEWEEWGDPRKEDFYFYMKSYSPVDNVSANVSCFSLTDINPSDRSSNEKISAESCPTSDLLVNNSYSGQTEAIESKCDTSVKCNLGNHDCLNPMNDILDTILFDFKGDQEKSRNKGEKREGTRKPKMCLQLQLLLLQLLPGFHLLGKIHLKNPLTMRVLKVRAHSESCRAIRFINEGLVILTGSPYCSILAIDIETGSPVSYGWMFIQLGDKYLLHKQSTKWITVMTMAPPRLEKGVGVLDKPVIEKTTPGRESEFDLRKSRKMAPPYRVMLQNDNYNKREYVVQVLMKGANISAITCDLSELCKDWLSILMIVTSARSSINIRHLEKATVSTGKEGLLSEGNGLLEMKACNIFGSFSQLYLEQGPKLTRIGRDAVLYVESLIESIMGGFEELINILGSEGASTRSQLKLQMAFDGQERYMKRSWEPSDKADLHFVYKDVEGVSTQWDDIQTKLRYLPPKPSAFKPDPFTPAEDEDSKPKTKSQIDKKTEELKDLEDDLDDSCFLKEYKKRLAEMKQTVEV